MQPRLKQGKSIFLFEDIIDISWKDIDKKSAEGSFKLKTNWTFKGKCLFRAKKQKNGQWLITKLAVAKKSSPKLSDGLTVFDLDKSK